MEEINENSCDLILTQNDEYEALLGLEKAKAEQQEALKVFVLLLKLNILIRWLIRLPRAGSQLRAENAHKIFVFGAKMWNFCRDE